MSDVVSTRTDADGPPARDACLKDRVSSLSKQTRQRWVQNAVGHCMSVAQVPEMHTSRIYEKSCYASRALRHSSAAGS